MLTGFYTVASGMMVQQRTLNVQANNLANVDTPGFKTERVVSTTFQQQFLNRIENGQATPIGKGSPIKLVEDVPTNFDSSLVQETLRPLDMAIMGEGFFKIQAGNETMYSRNGNFDVDDEGYLILRGAGRVLGKKGEIQVGGSNFTMTDDGEIYNTKGKRVDTLTAFVPREGAEVTRFTNGLYRIEGEGAGDAAQAANDVRLRRGYLEKSNIDMNQELTMAMATQRAFQSCSNALKVIDQLNAKTANEIASL